MNYYRHHIGDFDADTAHLSWMEDAAYRRLICLYYRREQPIPADIAQACRLVRAVSKQEREAVETVLREFFTLTDDGWRNKRCEEEIGASQSKADANRTNGVKGGRPRKTGTHEKPTGFLNGTHAEPTKNLSQEPIAKSQEPEEPSGSSLVASRRRRLPDDFCPNQAGLDKAHERGLDPGVELQKFSDYHRAKGSVMADWQAAWRTWVGNARRPTEHATLSDAGLRTAAAARAAKVMIFGRDAA